ncbi:MAG: nuclear transport factor 2 family protein [Leptolyngbya sp. Prado105]|jgi:ketosteroid isomerase-like protein|nr:nuclear transport factor 2 family protein [Leptolyngbya sp. Prado105]
MQSSEQQYRDRVQQNDFFDADLEDAHRKVSAQTAHTSVNPESNQKTEGSLAERFMQTLQQIEETKNVDPLVALFAEDADLSNLVMHQPIQGHKMIQQFWQNYLSVFDQIHSRFTYTSEGNGTITLEWVSEGTLSSGEPFSYRGVSILETQNGKVQHFRTYYDSATFLPQGAKQ